MQSQQEKWWESGPIVSDIDAAPSSVAQPAQNDQWWSSDPVVELSGSQQAPGAGVSAGRMPSGDDGAAARGGREEPGFFEGVGNFFTGADRETRATRDLPELGSSGLLAGLGISPAKAAQLSATMLVTPDPAEIGRMLREASPDIGLQQDEKGNLIAANNRTGARAVINKPGLSGLDIMQDSAAGAAFAPAAAAVPVTGGAMATAGLLGLAGAATETGIQGLQYAAGGDFDPEDIAVAGASGAAGELASRGLSAAGRGARNAIARRANAGTADAVVDGADDALRAIDPEAAKAIAKAIAGDVAVAAKNGGRRQITALNRIAEEVAPDEAILASAERLGMRDELIPSQYSTNQAYREVEQLLASVPGSHLNAQQKAATAALAQKADDFIVEFGGQLDTTVVSDSFKMKGLDLIESLGKDAGTLYDDIARQIPAATPVKASTATNYLTEKAASLGGAKYLSAIERRALKAIGDGPTYARLDSIRKQVGEGLSGRGPFKDAESGSLRRLYGALTDDQEAAAMSLGVGDTFKAAKALVAKRKALEDNLSAVLGKDLTGSLVPKLGAAMGSLSKGDFKQFDQIMSRVPDDMKGEVMLTAMNNVFTMGSRAEKQLSAPGFVDWYAGLKRNHGAYQRVSQHLPAGAKARLDDIYAVAKGIRDASRERVTTGRISTLNEYFADDNGLLGKLWDVGKKAGAAEGVTTTAGIPGVGAAAVLASAMSKERTPLQQAADQLLAGPKLRSAIEAHIKAGGKTAGAAGVKARLAEVALKRDPAYLRWLSHLSGGAKTKVATVGPLNYLLQREGDEEAEDAVFETLQKPDGKPFQAPGAARASRAYRDALKAGRQPEVVKVRGGYSVQVPAVQSPLERAAKESATSPDNDLPEPT